MSAATPTLPPQPWFIPGSACTNCGAQLAWRSGVGRVVITHATGEDRCVTTCARLAGIHASKAQAVLDQLEALLQSQTGEVAS